MAHQADIPKDRLTGAVRRSSVKKHVAAIHVSGKLTLLQRKLSNVLLLNAYDTLVSQPVHRIDARTLCLMIGYNSNDVDTLKEALTGLAETVATWDLLDEQGQQEWGVSSMLAYAKLKGGVCEYSYSPALAERLKDPSVFALINLNIQRRFSSGHALALYENCYRFVRTGSTGWWDLALFRKLMGVDDSAYYQSYKQLNAKIIKPAVAEVNRASNIVLEPDVRKQGRAVTAIRFRIRPNPQLSILELDDGGAIRKGQTYEQLCALRVSDRLARQWIAEYGEDYVNEKLAYVSRRNLVKSSSRYLSAALAQDYRDAPDGPPKDAPRRDRALRMRAVLEAAAARSPTQRDADKQAFKATLKDGSLRNDFDRHGWTSPLNAGAIADFWARISPGIFDPV